MSNPEHVEERAYRLRLQIEKLAYALREDGEFSIDDLEEFFMTLIDDMKEEEEADG